MPLRSRYPRASHTFSRLVGAGGLCYSTSLATGFQPSNPRKMKPLAVVVTASNFHSTVTTRRDLPARIATSSCEDWCVVYQKVRLSRKGVNSSVANQQLIRHDPLTSPIGLPDHLSFDLSGWRYRRVNPVVSEWNLTAECEERGREYRALLHGIDLRPKPLSKQKQHLQSTQYLTNRKRPALLSGTCSI